MPYSNVIERSKSFAAIVPPVRFSYSISVDLTSSKSRKSALIRLSGSSNVVGVIVVSAILSRITFWLVRDISLSNIIPLNVDPLLMIRVSTISPNTLSPETTSVRESSNLFPCASGKYLCIVSPS